MANRVNLKVELAGIGLQNPVLTASGTYGYGMEYADYYDPAVLGAVIVKGTTLLPRPGNPAPRIIETPAGMLNAIGLENPGVDVFLSEIVPELQARKITVIANIAGNTIEEYAALAGRLDGNAGIAGIELNISCPNVKQGGLQFGTDPGMVAAVISAAKASTSLPVIAKLSPNVTDIVAIARAARDAGADALAMINTLMGMAIDIHRKKPVLGNVFGGLSGPAIKPVALRMIYQVYREVDIPILGGGGIMNAVDALEFMMAGATAVSIGTASFVNPMAPVEIINGLEGYLHQQGLKSISELIGAAHR